MLYFLKKTSNNVLKQINIFGFSTNFRPFFIQSFIPENLLHIKINTVSRPFEIWENKICQLICQE